MNKIKNILGKIYYIIKMKVLVFTSGNAESFKRMLYCYGLIPSIIVVFYIDKKIVMYKNFFTFLVSLFLMIYFSWHVYVIWKTLKVQPQYKKPKKIKKKDLYANKTKEEIESIKKQNKKDFVDKLLLRKSWNDTPDYVIISCCEVLAIWMELNHILNYIGF
ncbi:MAG: hypothetical protein LBC92_05640 [Rickettsiales bacterium]|jgi:hypothetical protein|nr:hypothetical protein [Rickettsiales bacterium]